MLTRFKSFFLIAFILLAYSYISNIYREYAYADFKMHKEAENYRQEGYKSQMAGNIDAAISAYQKAVSVDEGYATPHNDLGILFEAKGWLDRAEVEYQRALTINPDYERAHTNLALLYERKGEIEKAAYHWMKRYKLGDLNDPWTKEARGRLEKLGLIEKETIPVKELKAEAIPEQKKSLDTGRQKSRTEDREKTEDWARVGPGHKDKKEHKETPAEAKSKFSNAIKPDNAESTPKAAEPKKKQHEARKNYNVKSKREIEAALKLAEQELRRQKAESQKKTSYKEVRSDGRSVKSYYSEANGYYRNGDYTKALDTIRIAVKQYPDEPSLLELEQTVKTRMKEESIEDHYNEGVMLYQKKDLSGARKEFEAIVDMLPE